MLIKKIKRGGNNFMDCKNKKDIDKECPCKETDCDNHGCCCSCVKYHRDAGGCPACFRDKNLLNSNIS